MASVRIHNDQENARPGKSAMATQAQPKRTAFGVLNENQQRNAQRKGVRNIQPVVEKNAYNKEQVNKEKPHCSNANKENYIRNPPVVPVAEFEAFKVYEDNTTYEDNANYEDKTTYQEKLELIDEKLRAKSTSHVYNGTSNDRFYTKTEVADMERQGLIPARAEPEGSEEPILMSLEKYDMSNISIGSLLESGRQKDLFFEMDEYRGDIYRYLREHELRNRPKAGYMKKQPDVTATMRTILIDWLVEVGLEYKLHNETLFLAINYIDRFLSYMSVVRGKLQLVGTAAMFLASKYEEIYPPNISEFVYITDDTYTTRQVIRMEQLILKVLGFDLSVPTSLTFITAICVANKQTKETMYFAMYLCELCLLNGDRYLEFLPSTLAAASIAIARHTLGNSAWPREFLSTTGYTLETMMPCIDFMSMMFRAAPSLSQQAIQTKYMNPKYMSVSGYKPKDVPILAK